MLYPRRLAALIEALRRLPGVGPRSAQRMAFHLLEKDPEAARALSGALTDAVEGIGRCGRCRMFTEAKVAWRTFEPTSTVISKSQSPASAIR